MKRTLTLLPLLLLIVAQAFAGRYYDPTIARFTTPDPALSEMSPQELLELQDGKLYTQSPYSYGYNNPLRYVDPDGRTPWDVLDIGFAIWSISDFVQNPTWANAGWAALDVTAAALPIAPSSGYFRRGAQATDQALGLLRKGDIAVPIAEGLVKRGDEFFANSTTVNELGQKLNFSKLTPEIQRSKNAIWQGKETGGVNRIVAYKDSKGNTVAVVHEVTDSQGRIVHRDFDAIRLESGQMINKDRSLDR